MLSSESAFPQDNDSFTAGATTWVLQEAPSWVGLAEIQNPSDSGGTLYVSHKTSLAGSARTAASDDEIEVVAGGSVVLVFAKTDTPATRKFCVCTPSSASQKINTLLERA